MDACRFPLVLLLLSVSYSKKESAITNSKNLFQVDQSQYKLTTPPSKQNFIEIQKAAAGFLSGFYRLCTKKREHLDPRGQRHT